MTNLEQYREEMSRFGTLEDVEREIRFAQGSVEPDDSATVYWLAALYERREVLAVTV